MNKNLKKLTNLSQEYGLYDTIPQEIQDLMPERKKVPKEGSYSAREAVTIGSKIGFNQALTEVEAVLPKMLALAEKRGAEEVYKQGYNQGHFDGSMNAKYDDTYYKPSSLTQTTMTNKQPERSVEEIVRNVVDSLEPIWTEADAYETEHGYPPLVSSRTLAIKAFTQTLQAERQRQEDIRKKAVEEVKTVIAKKENPQGKSKEWRDGYHKALCDMVETLTNPNNPK